MKKYLAAASAVAVLVGAAPAFAQNIDGSIGYSSFDTGDATVGAVTGRLGYSFNDVLGIEGEASFGVKDDTIVLPGPTNVDVEMKHQVAVYGTAGLPLGENGRVFARLGYGSTKLEASAAGVVASGSEESVNYGAGAQYFFDGANGIRADYTKYDFDDGVGDADVWSVSYVRRFR